MTGCLQILLMLAYPLVGTILIEYGMLRLMGERNRSVLRASVMMNVLTNVPLNISLLSINSAGWDVIAVGELVVLAVEMVWYRCVTHQWKKAATYSLLCNAASFLTGLLIDMVLLYFGYDFYELILNI